MVQPDKFKVKEENFWLQKPEIFLPGKKSCFYVLIITRRQSHLCCYLQNKNKYLGIYCYAPRLNGECDEFSYLK